MERDRVYIEYCTGCAKHQWCTNHNEAKYLKYFNDCNLAIMRENPSVQVSGNVVPPWLAKKYVTDEDQRSFGKQFFPRTGAFEVHFNRLVIFSKLESGFWPHPELLGKRISEIIELSRQPPPDKPSKVRTEASTTTKKRKKRKRKLRKARSPSTKTKKKDKPAQPPRYLFDNSGLDKRPSSPPERQTDNPRSLFDAEPNFGKFDVVAQPVFLSDSFDVAKVKPAGPDNQAKAKKESSKAKAKSQSSSSSSSSNHSGRKFKFPENSKQAEPEFNRKSFSAKKSSEGSGSGKEDDKYSDDEDEERYSEGKAGDQYSDDRDEERYSDDQGAGNYSDKYSDEKDSKHEDNSYSSESDRPKGGPAPNKRSRSHSSDEYSEPSKSSLSSSDKRSRNKNPDSFISPARPAAAPDSEDEYDDNYDEEEEEEEQDEASSSSDYSSQVTKSFGLSLPVGELNNKVRLTQKITYQNKTGEPCEFILTSNKPQLMEPKERVVKATIGQKAKFQLRFMPVAEPCEKKFILKVEGNGQLCEVIEIKATYE